MFEKGIKKKPTLSSRQGSKQCQILTGPRLLNAEITAPTASRVVGHMEGISDFERSCVFLLGGTGVSRGKSVSGVLSRWGEASLAAEGCVSGDLGSLPLMSKGV